MDMTRPVRLLPTMEMIEEELTLAKWQFTSSVRQKQKAYRGVRLYIGQQELQEDILYALGPGEANFPTDTHAYVCTDPIPGKADHLCIPDQRPEVLLDMLMELFSRFQHYEQRIGSLIYQRGSLSQLCQLGSQLLGNPVCIHDDWFIMVGASRDAEQVMAPEYAEGSSYGSVPRAIINDFRYDSDYLETYTYPDAQIWEDRSGISSLYVNLWDGRVYRGRLLVMMINRPFLRRDFLLAEALAQGAVFLLAYGERQGQEKYRGMDDRVRGLLQGRAVEAQDLAQLMQMLSWDAVDKYLCIRLKPQEGSPNTVMDRLLHSDLFQTFPGSYIMLEDREQCVTVNLTRNAMTLPQLHHTLAPLCRDYCLYAGISVPVTGIRELHLAYYQAGVALEQAFRLRNERWIVSFPECTLDFLMEHLDAPLTAQHLVDPELRILLEHDRETGSQYFETLRVYLLMERDIPRTAQELIIHRTTLLYRLKKIQSLIHINLDDPWQRLRLLLSLWILEEGNK